MKLHIKIENIQYRSYNPEDKIHKIICIIRWINPITGNIQRSVGVSKCNPNDEFDFIKGCRIAESRAKINMWEAFNKFVETTLTNVTYRHFKFIRHEKQHLHDLINDVKTK